MENGEVKNPSAAVLLRVAQAIKIDADELFEAAGYPTVRALRQIYQTYESTIEADLLRYLARLPRDRQRRLLLLLEGMEQVLGEGHNGSSSIDGAPADAETQSVDEGASVTGLRISTLHH